MPFRITIREVEAPNMESKEELAEAILKALGIMRKESKSKADVKILLELLEYRKLDFPLKPEELAMSAGIKRSQVYEHLRKYSEAGLIKKDAAIVGGKIKKGYLLRDKNLVKTLEKVKLDIERQWSEILKMAENLQELIRREKIRRAMIQK